MKKVFSSMLLLCMLFSIAAISSAGTKSIQNYDGYADLSALQQDVTVWDGGASFNVKLSTIHKDSGKSMQIVPIGEAHGSTYGVVVENLPAAAQNWEGADGIQFWVKGTGGTVTTPGYISFQFMFDDNDDPENPERWSGKDQLPYQLIDKNNNVENKMISGGVFTVMDGFEGVMKIPFTSFEALGWSLVDDELQLGSVKTIYFGIDAQFYKNKEIFIDSIQLYGSGIGNSSSLSSSSSSASSSASASAVSSQMSSASVSKSSVSSSMNDQSEVSGAADSSETESMSGSGESFASTVASSVIESGTDSTVNDNSKVSSASTESTDNNAGGSLIPIIAVLAALIAAAAIATYFLVLRRRKD